jgi:hypothetical protein
MFRKARGRFSSNQVSNCPPFQMSRTFDGLDVRTYTDVHHFARKIVTVCELPLKNAAMIRVISDVRFSIMGIVIRKLGHLEEANKWS